MKNVKCNYSFGINEDHYNFPLLSIHITSNLKDNCNNPMNIIYEEYLSVSKK